ncbi:MAG: GGDEF domain-containing protein [Burkholderiaceae bacterium]|nr:GGDEF domain-containing protein [Burkholderiaceae bacterium]
MHTLRRREAARELDLHASRNEVAALRAQLAESLVREAQARALARTDSLTRLGNRAAFLEQLDEAVADGAAKPAGFAVLFIDLDGFKAINDHHGHRIGDELLRLVGERLCASVRSSDVVARLGGDEFACLVHGGGPQERIAQVAGKLFDTLNGPYQLGSLSVTVQASVGIAMPEGGASAMALLERADAAMYRAKRLRTGCEFYGPHPDDCSADAGEIWALGAPQLSR